MTDKELLERAAKAAGLIGECHLLTGDCGDPAEPGGFRYEHPDGGHDWWNPLMDDGDALRLAVKLGMGISFGQYAPLDIYSVYISKVEGGDELAVGCITDGDEFGVVRRAIVRAAAQLA